MLRRGSHRSGRADITASGSSKHWFATRLLLLLRFEDAADDFGGRQRIAFQKKIELLPRHAVLSVSAIEPVLPLAVNQVQKIPQRTGISSDSVIAVMTSHLRFELFPLLSHRHVHVLSTPLSDVPDASYKA